MFDVGTALATVAYGASLFLAFFVLSSLNSRNADGQSLVFPVAFLLTVALYVLPLSVRSIFTLEIAGNISPQLQSFAPYIAYAILLCAVFNVTFALAFAQSSLRLPNQRPYRRFVLGQAEVLTLCVLVSVCIGMLTLLGTRVGGLKSLLLYGYRVTEIFAEAGHLAVALDWLLVLCLVLVFSGFIGKSRIHLASGLVLSIVLIGILVLMGRRGVVVVLTGSLLYAYHVCYRKLSLLKLAFVACILFVGLNFVGLLRGDTYDSFAGVIENVVARKSELNEDDAPSWFYVLSSGNFAVPFETFPQVIRSMGEKYLPGFGLYSFQSLTLLVPSALWPDRPLPLANWYMETFYGPTPKNEGRQFFFLTEAYMNFGPLGVIVWGLAVGFMMRKLVALARHSSVDPLIGTTVALLCASFLNFVAMDTVGFFIVFLKQYGAPLLMLLVVRSFAGRTAA